MPCGNRIWPSPQRTCPPALSEAVQSAASARKEWSKTMNRYFQKEGREYVFEDYHTPRPMLNYSWNKSFLSAFNHVATGHGLYCDKTTITATFVDPRGRVKLINDGNRFFYLRDRERGTVWNVAGYPTNTPLDRYRCTMGLGYAVYEAEKDGIASRTRVFVDGGDACEIWSITLTNTGSTPRQIQLFPAVEWSLEGYVARSDYFSYLSSACEQEEGLLFAYNRASERLHGRYNGFMAASRQPASFDTSLQAFLGTYGSFARPTALEAGACSNRLGICERLAAAMELRAALQPGESETLHVLIGSFETEDQARRMKKRLFAPRAIEREFDRLLEEKERLVQFLQIHTPDERLNHILNTWTKQQVVLCSEVGRGNSRGYRDVLQDAWGYVSFDSGAAGDKIAEALRHQYADGHAPRGWLPLDDRYYSDSPVWIPMAVNEYVKETGDFAFLDQVLPFLDGGEETVWEHCVRAVEHLYRDRGTHGLVLAHSGDWNDSLTGMGQGGKGESAWTTIALHYALLQMVEMAEHTLQSPEQCAHFLTYAEEIRRVVNEAAWDGRWYLEGFDDEGRPVGTHTESEGRIYLNPQTWAVISRVAPPERARTAMEQVDAQLECDYGTLTLSPAYTQPQPRIGRLTEFVPGIWENGCPYCHGSAFKIVADCLMGRGNEAYATLSRVMPDHPDNPMEHSGCEPYAFTNMYLGPQNPRAGFAMFGWITGTAGWMFRAVTQGILGFHCTYDGFDVAPCLPAAWESCRFIRRFRENTYTIDIENPHHRQSGVCLLEVDGISLPGHHVSYKEDGREHHIRVQLG